MVPIALEWVLHGTNLGAFPDGTLATGKKAIFVGSNFVHLEGDKIRSEQVYFDRLYEHKAARNRITLDTKRLFCRLRSGPA
jgi:hypothetical protein